MISRFLVPLSAGVLFVECAIALSAPSITFAASSGIAAHAKAAKASSTPLAFTVSGTVAGVYVYPGKKVSKDQVLMTIDSSLAVIQLDEALAALDYQTIKLGQLLSSAAATSSDAIRIAHDQDAVAAARQNAISMLIDSYIKAEDAIRNRADQIFSNVSGGSPQIILSASNQSMVSPLLNQVSSIEALLIGWKATLDGINTTTDVTALMDMQLRNLTTAKNFLDNVAQFVNFALPDAVTSQASLKIIRNDIFIGRADILAGSAEVLAAQSRLRDAQATLNLQQTAFANDSAFALQLQKAVVRQASDRAQELQLQIDHMSIRAPEDGMVTRVDTALGGQAVAHVPVVYVKPDHPVSSLVSLIQNRIAQMASAFNALTSSFAFLR